MFKNTSVLFLFLTMFCFSLQLKSFENNPYFEKVDQNLIAFLKNKNSIDILIKFENALPLPKLQVSPILDRDYKLKTIRNYLINQTQAQLPVIQFLESKKIKFKPFYIINALQIPDADQALIQTLVDFKEVKKIILNAKVKSDDFVNSQNDLHFARPIDVQQTSTTLNLVGAPEAWSKFQTKGEGIVVGIIDSGIEWRHPALLSRYRGKLKGHLGNWYDAIEPGREPFDQTGHGTHVAGIAVGNTDGLKGAPTIGVAPLAQWIGCRAMNKGTGTIASYLSCFEFMMAPYPANQDSKTGGNIQMAAHIINNSWSCSPAEGCRGDEFIEVIKNLQSAGIMVIAAAGNQGPNCGSLMRPPSFYSDVLTVGAWNHYRNEVPYFSNRGPSKWDGSVGIDLIAPGDGVDSAVPGGGYDSKSGTSMASPHVAGAVALLWSYDRSLIGDVKKTQEILKSSAKPVPDNESCGNYSGVKIPNAVSGYGMLSITSALTLISSN